MTIFYVPLESYEERYTSQLSCVGGWVEQAFLDVVRIEGDPGAAQGNTIKTGEVLDGCNRQRYASLQITKLCALAVSGQLTDSDIIYFDDFWTPGIEQFYYVCEQVKVYPRCYSFCWAQSVDKHDFTARWPWIRQFEKGIAARMSTTFVANEYLADLFREGIGGNVVAVGLPFNSEDIKRNYPTIGLDDKVKGRVVYSSRLDVEKNPNFFLDVAEDILSDKHAEGYSFVYCSGNDLRSNSPGVVERMHAMAMKWGYRFVIRTFLTKEQYYRELAQAQYQFNCADQDWVSYTLLEAITFGCVPVYPNYRSFPETFGWMRQENDFPLYTHKDVFQAKMALAFLGDGWEPGDWDGIVDHCDKALDRIKSYMTGAQVAAMFTGQQGSTR